MAAPAAPLTGRDAWRSDVPIGWCRMRPEDDPDLVLLVELGNTHPRIIQGLGGRWDSVERPGRTSLTHWPGHDPMAIELDLFFEDFDAGRSVEDAIDVLEALAGRGKRRSGERPPILKVDTGGVMSHDFHSDPDTRWVINGWSEANDDNDPLTNEHGNRVRQTITVTLLQHVEDDRLRSTSMAARQRRLAKKGATKRYRVKSGETMITIAAKELGDASRWREIQKLNGGGDPRAIKPGALLRLP